MVFGIGGTERVALVSEDGWGLQVASGAPMPAHLFLDCDCHHTPWVACLWNGLKESQVSDTTKEVGVSLSTMTRI